MLFHTPETNKKCKFLCHKFLTLIMSMYLWIFKEKTNKVLSSSEKNHFN